MALRPLAAGIAAALLLAPTLGAAQGGADDARFRAAQDRFDREYQIYREAVDRYQATRGAYRDAPPPVAPAGYGGGYRTAPDAYADDRYENGYDPSRYYRSGSYPTRTLSTDDRVYAGSDGRYYCRRNDGTTGLILGAVAGGVLGNIIDGGRSRAVGTILGGGGGALAGRAIDQNQSVRCQ